MVNLNYYLKKTHSHSKCKCIHHEIGLNGHGKVTTEVFDNVMFQIRKKYKDIKTR